MAAWKKIAAYRYRVALSLGQWLTSSIWQGMRAGHTFSWGKYRASSDPKVRGAPHVLQVERPSIR
jgi:hypothetical protein